MWQKHGVMQNEWNVLYEIDMKGKAKYDINLDEQTNPWIIHIFWKMYFIFNHTVSYQMKFSSVTRWEGMPNIHYIKENRI